MSRRVLHEVQGGVVVGGGVGDGAGEAGLGEVEFRVGWGKDGV